MSVDLLFEKNCYVYFCVVVSQYVLLGPHTSDLVYAYLAGYKQLKVFSGVLLCVS